MNKRSQIVYDLLQQYVPDPAIPLEHSDSYTLLIAVLLSAQCTDKRVNEVTPYLFAKAKTPQEMVKLSIEDIAAIIKPCGLSPTKGKHIWQLSKLLIEKFDGVVPSTFEELESLPGVGHKTASVVMAQAFGHPAFPVDTHIHRCAAKWGLSKGKTVEKTEVDLKKAFPKESWNKLHLQIILYARAHCPARGHRECPICQALKPSEVPILQSTSKSAAKGKSGAKRKALGGKSKMREEPPKEK